LNSRTKTREEIAPRWPHNAEAERSVLGGILVNNPGLAIVLEAGLQADHFFLPQHKLTFSAMVDLAEAHQPVDSITVTELLDRNKELQAAGGLEYIAQLMDGVHRAINVEHYARIIKEKALQRRAIHLADAIKTRAFDGEIDFEKIAELAALQKENPQTLHWESLQTEDDIIAQQGSRLAYIVDEIVPKQRITLLFGSEKSGKTVIALDLLKYVANGQPWLNRKTTKTSCLYLDFEDGVVGAYIAWLKDVGEEKIRFITLRSEKGIPALNDPALLSLCAQRQPLIVLDSLHKLFGRNKEGKFGSAWQSSDYEPVMEKIRQLCVAGATVILIHHATKSDIEQYRDSSAIGANVDFLFAVVGDEPDALGVKRIHLKGQPSRGAQPPTLHILAFPHIIEHGHLCLDAGLEAEDEIARRAVREIAKNGPANNKSDLAERMKGRKSNALHGIASALRQKWLIENEKGQIDLGDVQMPENGREPLRELTQSEFTGTNSGTSGTGTKNYPD
jgi:archaellum biogenesis ATPase FlaH